MNPFVNPRKRGVTLPKGCKDLPDVIRRSDSKHDEAEQFVHRVLSCAQRDGATELIVGIVSPSGVHIRRKVQGAWYVETPFPSQIRSDVVSELVRMAHFQIPGDGVLDERFCNIRLRWTVAMTSAEGECILERIDD